MPISDVPRCSSLVDIGSITMSQAVSEHRGTSISRCPAVPLLVASASVGRLRTAALAARGYKPLRPRLLGTRVP
jgi:hypothetical protein